MWIHLFGVTITLGIKLFSHHHTEIETLAKALMENVKQSLALYLPVKYLARVERPVIEVAELLVELKEESALKL